MKGPDLIEFSYILFFFKWLYLLMSSDIQENKGSQMCTKSDFISLNISVLNLDL